MPGGQSPGWIRSYGCWAVTEGGSLGKFGVLAWGSRRAGAGDGPGDLGAQPGRLEECGPTPSSSSASACLLS
jgi:hypothetical protein